MALGLVCSGLDSPVSAVISRGRFLAGFLE
jgi:hypothetical protein